MARVPCRVCKDGVFPGIDPQALFAAVRGRKGLRAAPPVRNTIDGHRAYYVWRMARFHAGLDVTMPVMASMSVLGDPFQPELDALASEIARRLHGTDLAGATRWALTLGRLASAPTGLPATAYGGGPVLGADVAKPEEELLELR